MSTVTTPITQLSIVIPMFNEADNAVPLVEEIQQALGGKIDYEIIVVDDGSTDETVARLRGLQQKIPQLRVLCHQQNYGQTASIVSGVRHARFEWITTLDGDGQNDPADIPKLIAAAHGAASHSLIAGSRQKRCDTWIRRLSSRIANGVRGALLRDRCADTGCGLKLFGRDAFLRLPHFNHLHRFLPALFQRLGGEIRVVAVNHRPRLRGKSKYGVMNRLWVGIIDLFGVVWLLRRPCNPEITSNE